MKNLNVRLKILISFGIIIVMILAFSFFIIFSNVSTNTYAGMMRYEAQTQSLCTSLVESFSQANAGINIINYSFDEGEYVHVLSSLSECRRTLQEMDNHIARDAALGVYRDDVNTITVNINAWDNNINEILELNRELESIITEAHATELILASQSTGIFDYQMELSKDEATQDIETSARLRRVSRIEQGVDISNRLNKIASSYELLFASLNISLAEEYLEYFDETVDILTVFHDESAL